MTIQLDRRNEISLETAWQVGFETKPVVFSERAKACITDSRQAFERLLRSDNPPYIYGSTTAPGARAKKTLSAEDQAKLIKAQNLWASRDIGIGQKMVPDHGMRLILMARLASYIEGHAAISLPTAEWVAGLMHQSMGAIPLDAATGPGEVMPLGCMYPNEIEITLQAGEIMALYNGSPCATGLALDAALTSRRRLRLVQRIMALSIEAIGAPLEAYDPAIASVTVDRHMKSVLATLNDHLRDVPRAGRLSHQAPVSWRILPTMLASCLQAVSGAEETALNAIRSVAQNPLYLPPDKDHPDGRMLSTGGYHNQQASRAIDGLNAAEADICVLAGKQTARLLDGVAFGLPKMLIEEGSSVIGTEFLAWAQTGLSDRARFAAMPATLPTGLEDPAGAQSDVASPIFLAYERHLALSDDTAAALAVLSIAIVQAYRLSGRRPPSALSEFHETVDRHVIPFEPEHFVALGQSMRDIKALYSAAVIGRGPLAAMLSDTLN